MPRKIGDLTRCAASVYRPDPMGRHDRRSPFVQWGLWGLVLSCAGAAGCGHKPDPVFCSEATLESFGEIDYDDHIQPFLDEYCTSCHSASVSGPDRHLAPDEVNFDDFDAARSHLADIALEVREYRMPPDFEDFPHPSLSERCLIVAWEDQGFPR